MSVTRDDVARFVGVSPATVSYVVNGGPRPVSAETRARVLRAIEELDYRPSAVARSLRLRRTSTLGLVIPDTYNPYFAELARGVEQAAFEHGYTVVLCHSGYDPARELQYLDVLRAERAAGILLVPATSGPEPIRRLAVHAVPLVLLDRVAHGQQSPSVLADNFQGGYVATTHLLDLGHRRIGCIARPVELSHSQERIRGYLAALRDHGLAPDDSLIAKGGFRIENGRQATLQLLDLDPRPTACFAYNDIMAIGALRAAHERGLRVPHDLSVVGFDDIEQASYTCPALTTVAQPKFDMGRRGAELLLKLIADHAAPRDADRPRQVAASEPLAIRLVVRESTGPAPATA